MAIRHDLDDNRLLATTTQDNNRALRFNRTLGSDVPHSKLFPQPSLESPAESPVASTHEHALKNRSFVRGHYAKVHVCPDCTG